MLGGCGSGVIVDAIKKHLGVELGQTTNDKKFTVIEVECLGACVNAPMVMIFKDTYEDLTPERLAEIIDAFEAGSGETIKTGPQTDRWFLGTWRCCA